MSYNGNEDELKPKAKRTTNKEHPDSEEEEITFIKLISAEGHEFLLEKNVALAANTIRTMLTSSFRESEENLIRFPDISGHILEEVIKYLHYKVKYSHSTTR